MQIQDGSTVRIHYTLSVDGQVTIDLNHSRAGKTLRFAVEVVHVG